jgi:hypothetical protein
MFPIFTALRQSRYQPDTVVESLQILMEEVYINCDVSAARMSVWALKRAARACRSWSQVVGGIARAMLL